MTILSIVLIILFFGFLVAIHEFGHFIAAKLMGVRVNEFAIGMGPLLFSREKGETLYSLRAFPIGGFCAMEGENEASDDPRSFHNKPGWKKLIILVAGAFMNFVAGVVLILIILMLVGSPAMPVFTGTMEGAEAVLETGLRPGDEFYSIDGHRTYFQSDVTLFLGRAGEDVEIVVLRDGEKVDLGVLHLPYRQLIDETGAQVTKRGIYIGAFQEDTPFTLLKNTWYQAIDYVRIVWLGLKDLISGSMGLGEMSGVIGITAVAGEVGQAGAEAAGLFGAVIRISDFAALIAINLEVMNLLPIPALDGGQILFVLVGGAYHLLTRKRIDQKYLSYINMIGFVCLIGLMILVAINDVNKYIL